MITKALALLLGALLLVTGGFETLASARSSTTVGASTPAVDEPGGGASTPVVEEPGWGASTPVVEEPAKPASRNHSLPLAGRIIALDPGHQLGNANFPAQINRLVPAGGFMKPCNTTGTATNGGYAEATFTFDVAVRLRRQLQALGARVIMSRQTNRADRWGPCIDVRGRLGNKVRADLKVSIHGDGSYAAGARGFHVIAPTNRAPWTSDIYVPSRRAALAAKAALVRGGFPVANYIAGGDGLDFRGDLGTLNLSDVPTIMVELGNMRSAADAAVMTSPAGRERYATALARGARVFLR